MSAVRMQEMVISCNFFFPPLGTRSKKHSLKLLVMLESEFNDIYISFEYTKEYSEEKYSRVDML